MSRKPAKTTTTRNNPSHLFASNKGKNQNGSMTSDTIADDIAAFKKRGGRIEVLGTTPIRANISAFSSRGNAQRKRPAAAKKAVAKKATG
ncbi:MAG TPA: hypothetical protein VLZ76_08305 [Lysobacter sp.]|jgi:hypothetical protein|nr:hypothetical protein [Lysobacter sp.]